MKISSIPACGLGFCFLLFSGLGFPPFSVAGEIDLPVAGWCVVGAKDQKFGPKEEAGKIIFGGEGFGSKGKNLAAFFPPTEIGEGQTLKMKLNVRFAGVAGTGNFRYGIFKKRSKEHSRGRAGKFAELVDHAEGGAGTLFRLVVDRGDGRATCLEPEAEEVGLGGRIFGIGNVDFGN